QNHQTIPYFLPVFIRITYTTSFNQSVNFNLPKLNQCVPSFAISVYPCLCCLNSIIQSINQSNNPCASLDHYPLCPQSINQSFNQSTYPYFHINLPLINQLPKTWTNIDSINVTSSHMGSGSGSSAAGSRLDDDNHSKMQQTIIEQGKTIEKMAEEIKALKDQLQEKPFMEEQQFYREYFMALAISVKVNQCYLGKNYDQISLQILYERARQQEIPWYGLMDWVPKQIILKEDSGGAHTMVNTAPIEVAGKPHHKGNRLTRKFGGILHLQPPVKN
ncbi:hypothetical protein SAMD00019534_085110, partial [Acytostelium subglobosum LB1]|uniref:hypothetical protein n=1 Tax=Acytostelium subglobosum LB1 TaxID=1410327 RepID=UPI0006448171